MIRRRRSFLTALLLAASAAAIASPPALAATATPSWRIESISAPTHFTPGLTTGVNMYIIQALNVGGAPTDGSTITVTDNLPAGFSVQPTPEGGGLGALSPAITDPSHTLGENLCDPGPPVTCKITHKVLPGERLTAYIPLQNPASGPATVTHEVTVSGGGAPPATSTEVTPFTAGPTPFTVGQAPFGIQHVGTLLSAADGSSVSQAGERPYGFNFGFALNAALMPAEGNAPTWGMTTSENAEDLTVNLPPGLVVNPTAIPRCTEVQLETQTTSAAIGCPDGSAIGVIRSELFAIFGFPAAASSNPVYNMVPPPGFAGEIAFMPVGAGFYIHVLASVDPANNYSIKTDTFNVTRFADLRGASVEIWGDPADPVRDLMRGNCGFNGGFEFDTCPVPPDPDPVLTMPTSCPDALEASLEATSWLTDSSDAASAVMKDVDGSTAPITGCGALDFQPSLEARPTTNVADSPSGLDVDLHIPQTNSRDTLATAHLKDAVVTLPEGITINPSGGNGLEACSSAQIGLVTPIGQEPIRFNGERPSCPDAAKVGTVQVITPLLDNGLPGSVYVAKPFDNPFDSMLAIYIVVDDPQTGVVVKLPGHIVADPQTGRLTTTFKENPQLPFEDFELHFFGGAGGALRTPELCGDYSTTSELTPWSAPDSGPPATPQDDYSITQGPSGPCPKSAAEVPNSPSFDAGTISPIAGIHSPFVLHMRRADATQQFSAISISPPPGMVAKLAGTAICPDSALAAAASKSGQEEKDNPSCPASSEVGTTIAGVGAGPAPYYAMGKSYLSGPYKGAPLSFTVITPATAGPFDLGTVVVKAAVYIDPKTTKITAITDPLPTILQGIPLDVRTIDQVIDKADFTLNGTSCEPSSVDGSLTTTLGQTKSLFSRFQLGDCTALGFKPKLTLRLKGGTTRGKHPALTATLETRAGDANIAAASVALPRSEFLDQAHIGTVCTRVQFAADQCPAASIYGTATVTTPLLDYPLTGNVYLRSSDNLLPDLVPDLRGPSFQPLRLEAAGRTDSVKRGLRNSFDFVPDAPFTKFTLSLFGGKKGLLQNSTNICKELNRATAKYTAHNGAVYEAKPALKAKCGKKSRKGKAKKGKRRGHRRH